MSKAGFFLWILVCGVLVLDIGNACVRAEDSGSVMKAQEVDIVNAGGVTVIQLLDTVDGPEINLSDPNGKMRAGVGTPVNGGEVVFWDAEKNDVTIFGGTNQKGGLMDALGFIPSGQANVGLLSESDSDGLTISDKSGKERVSISYLPKGDDAIFATESAKDKTAIYAGVLGKLIHTVLEDPNGTPRADFGIDPDDNAYFGTGAKDGSVAWQKTFDANGSPSEISDNSGGSSNDNSSGPAVHALRQRTGN